MELLDRNRLHLFPLSERHHKLVMEDIAVLPDAPAPEVPDEEMARITRAADRIRAARAAGRPVMLTYGAHLIKNGLAPLVIHLIEQGWVTHVATNGAGSIHDWEFAYLGKSTEDVRTNTAAGCFGIWQETGRFINLAVVLGTAQGLGYGQSVGKMVADDGLDLPDPADLRKQIADGARDDQPSDTLAGKADLLNEMMKFGLKAGRLDIPHPWKRFSVQGSAWAHGVPFTVHPGIGYDIIYTHPWNCGGAIGRGALTDFLAYANSVSQLDGGVHLSVGSAVMAPMIFEKSVSMANNLAIAEGRKPLSRHHMVVVDLQDGGGWDWSQGEPPMSNPAYYLRFCKSFYRMGGTLDYVCLDNRAFMANLCQLLGNATMAR